MERYRASGLKSGAHEDVCVILPTLNEAGYIRSMISSIRRVSARYRIIVVDGLSSDGTATIAKKCGAKVILVKGGKGAAIKKAFSSINSRFAVLLDADASYDPSEIPGLLAALRDHDAVVGSRFTGEIEQYAMSQVNRLGNILLSRLSGLLYGAKITDVCSGFWGFRKVAYKKLCIDAQNFELEANFYVQCIKKRLKLAERPIRYRRRQGKSKLRISDGIAIGAYLTKSRF